MKKRMFQLIALLMVCIMGFAGCSNGSGSSSASTEAKSNDQVIVALNGEPACLVGGFTANTGVYLCSEQALEPLIDEDKDGNIVPLLATEWELVDGKDYVFTLREGVKFHNGEPLTADDVVFTYTRYLEEGFAATFMSAIDHIEKIDDSHVKIVYKTAYGPALSTLAGNNMGIFSKKAYEEAGYDAFLRAPVGTGAYKFVEWKAGDFIRYEANEEYWGGAPAIKNLIFRIYPDSSTAAIALENGEIDVLLNPAETDRSNLTNSSKVYFDETPSTMVTWAFFNCGEGSRFTDQRLREAFSYAIDREAVILGAVEGNGVLVNSMFPNNMPLSDNDYVARGYDKDKAIALMEECGYGPANRFQITVRVPQSNYYYKPMEIMQAMLSEVYVDMTLEAMETAAWFTDVLQAQDYEFNIIPTNIAFLDCDERYALFHSGEAQNNFGVSDPELDAAFDTNRTSTDIEERRKACSDIIRIFDEKAYIIPLFGSMRTIAFNNQLQGVAADAGYSYQVQEWSWA